MSNDTFREDFIPYPRIDDPKFYKKIVSKKEFNKTATESNPYDDLLEDTPESSKLREEEVKKMCSQTSFNLQPYQEFIRNYISSGTSYNGILAFWGVGTGKTCGAIQIAEGLKDTVKRNGGKIYIISKKQIRPNFIKEIYSIDRETNEMIPGSKQCTGATYYISPDEIPDEKLREKRIRAKWREYYRFFGMQEFTNFADIKVKGAYKEFYGATVVRDSTGAIISNARDGYFSNSVFIIDEAHGLTGESKSKEEGSENSKDKKSSSKGKSGDTDTESESDALDDDESSSASDDDESSSKKTSRSKSSKSSKTPKKERLISKNGPLTILHEIITYNKNLKFILLSATPIKDNKRELVDLLNILHHNDGRPLVDEKKLFGTAVDGSLNIDEEYLKELCKGYISYVRGENPISFPQILPAVDSTYLPKPQFDEKGAPFPQEEYIKYTPLLKCEMSDYQFTEYWNTLNDRSKNKPSNKKRGKSIDLYGRQAGNIIFPPVTEKAKSYNDDNVRSLLSNPQSTGNKGFERIFVVKKPHKNDAIQLPSTSTKRKQFIKIPTQYELTDDSYFNEFLYNDDPSIGLGKYSTKMWTFLNRLINGVDGLAYFYSDFKECGALLGALILEINGFKKYEKKSSAENRLLKLSPELASKLAKDKNRFRCICGKLKNDPIHSLTKETGTTGTTGTTGSN